MGAVDGLCHEVIREVSNYQVIREVAKAIERNFSAQAQRVRYLNDTLLQPHSIAIMHSTMSADFSFSFFAEIDHLDVVRTIGVVPEDEAAAQTSCTDLQESGERALNPG